MQQYSLLNTSPKWENCFYFFLFWIPFNTRENVIKHTRCRSRCGVNLFFFYVSWAHRFTIILFVIMGNFEPLCITSAGLKYWLLFPLLVCLIRLKMTAWVDSCNFWELNLATPAIEVVRMHLSQVWAPILIPMTFRMNSWAASPLWLLELLVKLWILELI